MAVSKENIHQETNPSIDESELEQYGVWVKAGPEDVIEADAEDEGFTLDDLSEDALTNAENDFLSSDTPDKGGVEDMADELEEVSLDSLAEDEDAGFADELDQAELAVAAGERFEAVPEDELVELTLDEIAIDDSGSDDELEMLDLELDEESAPEEPVDSPGDDDLFTLEEDDLTIDLGQETEELGMDISDEMGTLGDLEDELILDDLPEDKTASPEAAPESVGRSAGSGEGIVDDDLNFEEELPDDLNDLTLNLDDLDVDAFADPQIGASAEPDPLELEDDLANLSGEILTEIEEVEDLDLSGLPAEDESFGELTDDDLTQADEGELPELGGEEDFTELTLDETSPDATADELALGDISLDDEFVSTIGADVGEMDSLDLLDLSDESGDPSGDDFLEAIDTEEDLLDLSDLAESADDAGPREGETAPVAPAAPSTEKSATILENIERELSSIRTEIGDLKRELGQLRGASAAVAPIVAEEATDDGTVGFFEGSEDDDETIALTGAELDNIMNTADFVEETGQPTEVDDFIAPVDAPALDELLPEADFDAFPITEISLEEPLDDSDPIEIDLDANDTVALVGSEDEVEVLASMDIDAELADIEELEDTSESAMEMAINDLPDLDLSDDSEILDTEVIMDAEPMDEPSVDLGPMDEASGDLESLDELGLSDESDFEVSDDLDLIEEDDLLEVPAPISSPAIGQAARNADTALPENLKGELRSVLSYMDQLLESLPEQKIQEFAQSDHFTVYRRLFEELGLEQ